MYVGIKINKVQTLEEMREMIKKAFGFAVAVKYMNSETIKFFLAKASLEEKALQALVEKHAQITTKEGA